MTLENWNEYTGSSWLKAEDVKSSDEAYAIVNVEISEEDNRPVLTLEREEKQSKFSLNVTNANKCKDFVDSPLQLMGKKLYFNKVRVMSPSTKKEVDSLRITKVE